MVPRCSTTWRAVYRRVVPANRGLSNHFWVSAISCSNKVMSALPLAGRDPHEHRSSWRCHPLGETLIGAPHQELTALFNEPEALIATRHQEPCLLRKIQNSETGELLTPYMQEENHPPTGPTKLSAAGGASPVPSSPRRLNPDNSRTPSRNTCKSLREEESLAPRWTSSAVHIVPARDFSLGWGRPTTAMPGVSQRRSDEVSGRHPCAGGAWRPLDPRDPRDGWSRS